MAWRILNEAKIVKDTVTGDVGILTDCSCGEVKTLAHTDNISFLTNGVIDSRIDAMDEQTTESVLMNSYPGKAHIKGIYGASEQKQYTGKNLLSNTASSGEVEGVTFTVNDDGSVTASGTAAANAYFWVGTVDTKSDKYICSIGFMGTANITTAIYLNDVWKGFNGQGGNEEFSLDCAEGDVLKFGLYIGAGQTVNTTFYPMVRLASEASSEYEPYVGGVTSPNPDYQQDVIFAGSNGYFDGELLQGYYNSSNGAYATNNANAVCSKNAIPCSVGDSITVTYPDVVNQIRITYYNNGTYVTFEVANSVLEYTFTVPTNATEFHISIVANSETTPTNAKHICVTINGKYALVVKNSNKNLWEFGDVSGTTSSIITLGKALPQGTYTISSLVTSSDTDSTKNRIVLYSEDLQQSLNVDVTRNTRTSATFTTTFDVKTARFWGASGSSTSSGDTFTYSNIQLEFGDTMTDFVPHEEQTTYIPLDEPLRSVGDVKDEIVCVDGVYGVTRRIGSIVIDGDENLNLSTINDYGICNFYLYDATNFKAKNYNAICNRFTLDTTSIVNVTKECFTLNTLGYLYFRIKSERLSTVDEFKAWAADNPIEVYYILATETFTPFDDQRLFYSVKTFSDVTHVKISGNASADIEYGVTENGARAIDDKLTIKGNEARIKALENAVLSLGGNV